MSVIVQVSGLQLFLFPKSHWTMPRSSSTMLIVEGPLKGHFLKKIKHFVDFIVSVSKTYYFEYWVGNIKMKSKILILSLWTPLPNDPRTGKCKLWITWGLDVGPMSKGLMVLLLKVVGLNCAINLVINVSSLPLDCWKLVTMGMESQCRWCVMECGPSGHRFCVCVCVCPCGIPGLFYFQYFPLKCSFVWNKRAERIGLVHLAQVS